MSDGLHEDWLAGGSRRAVARERIFKAAFELIRKRGVDNVTADDVAARAGCSRATLYRHVGGMPAILKGVVQRRSTAMVRQVEQRVAGLSGADRVVEVVLAVADAVRADSVLFEAATRCSKDEIRAHLDSREARTTLLASCGLDPSDATAARVLIRVTWSLVTFPLGDAAEQRQVLGRFLGPAFATAGD